MPSASRYPEADHALGSVVLTAPGGKAAFPKRARYFHSYAELSGMKNGCGIFCSSVAYMSLHTACKYLVLLSFS